MATEQSGGGGMMLVGIAVLAIVALVAVFLVIQSQRNTPGQQAADAATSIASSTAKAADDVGAAVNPNR